MILTWHVHVFYQYQTTDIDIPISVVAASSLEYIGALLLAMSTVDCSASVFLLSTVASSLSYVFAIYPRGFFLGGVLNLVGKLPWGLTGTFKFEGPSFSIPSKPIGEVTVAFWTIFMFFGFSVAVATISLGIQTYFVGHWVWTCPKLLHLLHWGGTHSCSTALEVYHHLLATGRQTWRGFSRTHFIKDFCMYQSNHSEFAISLLMNKWTSIIIAIFLTIESDHNFKSREENLKILPILEQ